MTTAVPLTPDDDYARRTLDEHIEAYDVEPAASTWWERLLAWLNEALQLNVDPAAAGNVATYGLLAVAIGVVVVLLVKYFRVPAPSGDATESAGTLADPAITAQEYLVQAQHQLAAGQWGQASLAAFRCLVRTAAERNLVDITPATTATVFGWHLGIRFPDLQHTITDAATEFNTLSYGAGTPTKHRAETMVKLAQDLGTAQPQPLNPQHQSPARMMPR